jgi:phosphate transport system substrate-binding protein
VRQRLELVIAFIVGLSAIAAARALPGVLSRHVVVARGSDTLRPLAQAWSEMLMARTSRIGVTVTGGGSGTGLAFLASGGCDIALSSRKMKKSESEAIVKAGRTPKATPVAIDAVVIAVHPSNPVADLSLPDLADIYTGRKTNWKEVGGDDRPIALLARDATSGTHVFFLEHVIRGGSDQSEATYAPATTFVSDPEAMAERIAADPRAIGYYGLGVKNEKNRHLPIAATEGAEAVAATADTAAAGKYPVARPLFIYTAGEPSAAAREYIDFCVSPEGQAVVKKHDLVPLAAAPDFLSKLLK